MEESENWGSSNDKKGVRLRFSLLWLWRKNVKSRGSAMLKKGTAIHHAPCIDTVRITDLAADDKRAGITGRANAETRHVLERGAIVSVECSWIITADAAPEVTLAFSHEGLHSQVRKQCVIPAVEADYEVVCSRRHAAAQAPDALHLLKQ